VSRRRPGVNWTVDGGVARITLCRPERGNRIDLDGAQRLCAAVEAIELDDDVGVVVVAAEGKAFCLGVEDGGDWEWRHDWVAAVGGLTHPVVAAVNGAAVAAGCELTLACDLRLVSARAVFTLPQIGAGVLPRHGALQRLPRLVGRMRALDWLLSGRRIGAREAERAGLATRVVPPARLAATVRREVGALAAKGPIALRLAKEAVNKGLDLTLEQGMRLEQDLYVLLQTTADRVEGIQAFLSKRRPKFRGR